MSEPIPESIPTSAGKSSRPARKKARVADTPASLQTSQIEALFAHPDREITLPGSTSARGLAPPPEIVANVQGSSAGAGSGEFHVYKAARRKENERRRLMDAEVEREKQDHQFEQRRKELKQQDEAKLSKNQMKRAKAKARQDKKKHAIAAGGDVSRTDSVGKGAEAKVKRNIIPVKLAANDATEVVENLKESPSPSGNELAHPGITIHED